MGRIPSASTLASSLCQVGERAPPALLEQCCRIKRQFKLTGTSEISNPASCSEKTFGFHCSSSALSGNTGRSVSAWSQRDKPCRVLAMLLLLLGSHHSRSLRPCRSTTGVAFPWQASEVELGSGSEISPVQESPEQGQGFAASPRATAQGPYRQSPPQFCQASWWGSTKLRYKTKTKSPRGTSPAESSPHMQRSLLFFFPFEISNSSLWTKSCLSENIDLRPLTKLHSKQS